MSCEPRDHLTVADITLEDVEAFGREFIKRVYFETLVHGSLDAAGAKNIQDMLERVIQPRALTPAEKRRYRELILPPSEFMFADDPTDTQTRSTSGSAP